MGVHSNATQPTVKIKANDMAAPKGNRFWKELMIFAPIIDCFGQQLTIMKANESIFNFVTR